MRNTTEISNIELLINGWTLFTHDTKDDALIFLANKIGSIYPDNNGNIVQYLKPKDKGQGIKSSFSFNHGFGEFPYHTDTAFWEIPARLILMTSEMKSECDTILIDIKRLLDNLTSDQLTIFYNSVFTLKTPNEIKFVSVLLREKGNSIFRYDPNIMTPFNHSAKITSEIINSFIIKTEPITIKWTGENVAVLDNWRFLHKRSSCKNELNRTLKRIYINQ